MELDIKVRLMAGESIAMGPGKAELLEAIARTGSISAAGRSLNMSYRRAWQLVDLMNRMFQEPLVRSAAGGPHGGGAQVTEFGQHVLARYRAMQEAALAAAQAHVTGLAELMRVPDAPPEPGPAQPA